MYLIIVLVDNFASTMQLCIYTLLHKFWLGAHSHIQASGNREGSLRLLEVSLDIHLIHNALQLDLEGGPASNSLLPDVSVYEYGSSSVVVLIATGAAVYRLTLPHPAAVLKVGVAIITCN